MKYVKDPNLLTKYCEPVSDADVELQNCPFEYEYDNSPISSPSIALTPSQQPTGILMLSLPSTDDSNSQNTPQENEEFETPPEQNNSSQPYFSGSDDPKPSTSETLDSHNGDNEGVNLGNDSDELGLSNRGEIEERLRKRYRVSEEDLDVKKEPIFIEIDETQTQGVDTEVIECEENFKVYERSVERNADESIVKMSERGDEGEVRESGERGVERNVDCSNVEVSERGEEEGEGGANNNNNVPSVVPRVGSEEGRVDVEVMPILGCGEDVSDRPSAQQEGSGGEVRENGEGGVDGDEKLNGVGIGEMHVNGIKDGDGERGVVSRNLDEKEKSNGVCVKEMRSNGITGSGSVGGGSVKGRRELPLSMRGGDKNDGLVEDVGRRETTNGGRFKDLMEAFSMVVGDVNGDNKNDADFFETAKRRGVTFPRPRWWPPEGFSD